MHSQSKEKEKKHNNIAPCKICGCDDWDLRYSGKIRSSAFGTLSTNEKEVYVCEKCGAGYLPGDPIDYKPNWYREAVDKTVSMSELHKIHDQKSIEHLDVVGSDNLRGKRVLDIGAGSGCFLDLAQGLANQTYAVEPSQLFQRELGRKGHSVFPDMTQALGTLSNTVDLAVSFDVIEHIEEPLQFLAQAYEALKPGARIVVGTPNLDDWLLSLLPQEYGQFFFREAHRWYFNAESLVWVMKSAGFKFLKRQYCQRYDLGNVMYWLRDKRPTGNHDKMFSKTLDGHFKAFLEERGTADRLYVTAVK